MTDYADGYNLGGTYDAYDAAGYNGGYEDGAGGDPDSYYADLGPSQYEEYYAAYSAKPEEPPPVVAAPSGMGEPAVTVEQRASFAAEASLQVASCDGALDIALATTELLQESINSSLVVLEVCLGLLQGPRILAWWPAGALDADCWLCDLTGSMVAAVKQPHRCTCCAITVLLAGKRETM